MILRSPSCKPQVELGSNKAECKNSDDTVNDLQNTENHVANFPCRVFIQEEHDRFLIVCTLQSNRGRHRV